MITLVRALETYLNGRLMLQEVESFQDALQEPFFQMGVILRNALENTERLRDFESRIYENPEELQQRQLIQFCMDVIGIS